MRLFIAAASLFCLAHAFGVARAGVNQDSLTFHLSTGVAGQKVFVAGDLSMWEADRMPLSEVSPGEYELTVPRPWLHRVVYKFVVNGKWREDPTNPNQV